MNCGGTLATEKAFGEDAGALAAAEKMCQSGRLEDAAQHLQPLLDRVPEAHLILANAYREAYLGAYAGSPATADSALGKALDHAKMALDAGVAIAEEDLRTFASAFALRKRAAEGVRFAERLYELSDNKEESAAFVHEYRKSNDLGVIWQFADRQGKIIFETASPSEVRARLLSGLLPRTSLCSKNKVGPFEPIAASIGEEHFQVGVLLNPIKAHVRSGAQAGVGVLGLLGCLGLAIGCVVLLLSVGFIGIVAMARDLILVLFALLLGGCALGAFVGLIVGLLRYPSLRKAMLQR